MDSDSWSDRLASASRRYQLDFLSRSGEFDKNYNLDLFFLNLRFDWFCLKFNLDSIAKISMIFRPQICFLLN
jgi:hypothetical protein